MALRCVRPPIILMGNARSGTTLLADLLERLGLFIGHEKIVVDQEAKYFFSVNRKILQHIHGHWDNPAPVRYFLGNPDAVDETVRCIEADLRSYRIMNFLGPRNFVRYRSIERFDRPWGWKDPRNVVTLPLWLKVFPQAKIVYIVRNGVDVAQSLVVMEEKVVAQRRRKRRRLIPSLRKRSVLERAGFKGAVRCLSLEGGFSLWEEYAAYGEEHLAAAPNERIVLQYEHLLTDPKPFLSELVRFCGLDAPPDTVLDDAAANIDRKRAFAFTEEPALRDFYLKVKETSWMKRFGYSEVL